jgi:heme-degrading monooxygenase HmoA
MIARYFRGWTKLSNADAYENHLKEKILPALRSIPGYKGGYVLRRNVPDEVEFVVINLFDSIQAVQAFAGSDYSAAKFEPEARQLLAKVEPLALHYEIRASTVP